ncbi:Uncharacterised protein [uncultured archaeon]|nr:Uncharacterised protein [uncultured archaeon]
MKLVDKFFETIFNKTLHSKLSADYSPILKAEQLQPKVLLDSSKVLPVLLASRENSLNFFFDALTKVKKSRIGDFNPDAFIDDIDSSQRSLDKKGLSKKVFKKPKFAMAVILEALTDSLEQVKKTKDAEPYLSLVHFLKATSDKDHWLKDFTKKGDDNYFSPSELSFMSDKLVEASAQVQFSLEKCLIDYKNELKQKPHSEEYVLTASEVKSFFVDFHSDPSYYIKRALNTRSSDSSKRDRLAKQMNDRTRSLRRKFGIYSLVLGLPRKHISTSVNDWINSLSKIPSNEKRSLFEKYSSQPVELEKKIQPTELSDEQFYHKFPKLFLYSELKPGDRVSSSLIDSFSRNANRLSLKKTLTGFDAVKNHNLPLPEVLRVLKVHNPSLTDLLENYETSTGHIVFGKDKKKKLQTLIKDYGLTRQHFNELNDQGIKWNNFTVKELSDLLSKPPEKRFELVRRIRQKGVHPNVQVQVTPIEHSPMNFKELFGQLTYPTEVRDYFRGKKIDHERFLELLTRSFRLHTGRPLISQGYADYSGVRGNILTSSKVMDLTPSEFSEFEKELKKLDLLDFKKQGSALTLNITPSHPVGKLIMNSLSGWMKRIERQRY